MKIVIEAEPTEIAAPVVALGYKEGNGLLPRITRKIHNKIFSI